MASWNTARMQGPSEPRLYIPALSSVRGSCPPRLMQPLCLQMPMGWTCLQWLSMSLVTPLV